MLSKITVDDKEISLLNHHGFPYQVFDSTPEQNKNVFKFFDDAIEKWNPDIVIGDFNANDFMPLMDKTDRKYIRTINDITTVEDERFDDILVIKGSNYSSKKIKLLSDHFMVITILY